MGNTVRNFQTSEFLEIRLHSSDYRFESRNSAIKFDLNCMPVLYCTPAYSQYVSLAYFSWNLNLHINIVPFATWLLVYAWSISHRVGSVVPTSVVIEAVCAIFVAFWTVSLEFVCSHYRNFQFMIATCLKRNTAVQCVRRVANWSWADFISASFYWTGSVRYDSSAISYIPE